MNPEYPFITVDPVAPVIAFYVSKHEAVRTVTVYEDRKVMINVDLTSDGIATLIEIIGLAVNPLAELQERLF